MDGTILIAVAPGELLDRLSILEIKLARMSDPDKLANVRAEHDLLTAARDRDIPASAPLDDLFARLKQVNETLWDVEDDIREEDRRGRFGERYIELARSVYVTNDERAAVKKEINLLLGSAIVEEKSYAPYR